MATELITALAELDGLIATETVRARHIELVRIRDRVAEAVDREHDSG